MFVAAAVQFLFEVNSINNTVLKLRKQFLSPYWNDIPCLQGSSPTMLHEKHPLP